MLQLKNTLDDQETKFLLEQLKLQEDYQSSIEQYQKVAKAGIAQWVQDFKADKIRLTGIDDLEKLIKIDLHLQEKRIKENKPTQ